MQYEIYFLSNGEPIISGTYGNSCRGLSLGFFSESLNISTQWNYYPFSNFESFKKTLNDKKLARISKRIEEGKSNNLGYKTIFYSLVQKKSNPILVAETYQIDNKTQMRTYSPYSNYIRDKAFMLEVNIDHEYVSDHLLNFNSVNTSNLQPGIGLIKTDSSYVGVYIENEYFYLSNTQFAKSKPQKIRIFDENLSQISSPKFKIVGSDGQNIFVAGTAIFSSNVNQHFKSEEFFILRKYTLESK